VTVLATSSGEGSAAAAALREALAANLGWLTADKALDLLARVAPGATHLVLDADERRGLLAVGDGRREVRW
jgi:hypothetical protein